MIDWSTTAFIFPGQGSQVVGMGQDLAAAFPAARAVYDQADERLGFKLSDLCFNGPEEDLNQTLNTQPAVFATSMAMLRVLQTTLPEAKPVMAAGHSFGEITALVAAGSLSFEAGLLLARERGRVMQDSGTQMPGAMAALLGLDLAAIQEACAQAAARTGGVIVVANDNCPGQVVISGEPAALDAALEIAGQMGARRVVRLAVSIASHSPLMEPAAERFRQTLAQTPFLTPTLPVYGNLNAAPLNSVDSIRQELGNQLTGSVRWTESVQAMIAAGAQTFIEIGPKDVLTGLVKRIDRSVRAIALNNAAALQALLAE